MNATDRLLCNLLRSLYFYAAHYHFTSMAKHIPGVKNVAADALSNENLPLIHSLFPQVPRHTIPHTLAQLLLQIPDWNSGSWMSQFRGSLLPDFPWRQWIFTVLAFLVSCHFVVRLIFLPSLSQRAHCVGLSPCWSTSTLHLEPFASNSVCCISTRLLVVGLTLWCQTRPNCTTYYVASQDQHTVMLIHFTYQSPWMFSQIVPQIEVPCQTSMKWTFYGRLPHLDSFGPGSSYQYSAVTKYTAHSGWCQSRWSHQSHVFGSHTAS